MHKSFGLLLVILLPWITDAQEPVSWSYTAQKKGDKTYEVHLTATVKRPWHIYSSTTPEGGPKPTVISFSKNPVLTLSGKLKEIGALQQKHEEVFDIDVRYFDDKVDFVQTVNTKSNVKTALTGSIEYMVCNDTQCLPPKTIPFSVKLE